MPDHPYTPNVLHCREHDMGDCPYHDGGPCQYRDEFDDTVCGKSADAHNENVWTPKGRPPLVQYRASMFITGDDIGADALAWLLERQTAALGFTARVERLERFDGGRS